MGKVSKTLILYALLHGSVNCHVDSSSYEASGFDLRDVQIYTADVLKKLRILR